LRIDKLIAVLECAERRGEHIKIYKNEDVRVEVEIWVYPYPEQAGISRANAYISIYINDKLVVNRKYVGYFSNWCRVIGRYTGSPIYITISKPHDIVGPGVHEVRVVCYVDYYGTAEKTLTLEILPTEVPILQSLELKVDAAQEKTVVVIDRPEYIETFDLKVIAKLTGPTIEGRRYTVDIYVVSPTGYTFRGWEVTVEIPSGSDCGEAFLRDCKLLLEGRYEIYAQYGNIKSNPVYVTVVKPKLIALESYLVIDTKQVVEGTITHLEKPKIKVKAKQSIKLNRPVTYQVHAKVFEGIHTDYSTKLEEQFFVYWQPIDIEFKENEVETEKIVELNTTLEKDRDYTIFVIW